MNPASCPVCAESFTPKTSNQKYCSATCCTYAQDLKAVGDRFVIFKRDAFQCIYCGASPRRDGVKLVCDHIIPHHVGGLDTADDLVTACTRCNSAKGGALLPEEVLRDIQNSVVDKNMEADILHKKGIKGSHCRGKEPRVS